MVRAEFSPGWKILMTNLTTVIKLKLNRYIVGLAVSTDWSLPHYFNRDIHTYFIANTGLADKPLDPHGVAC